MERVVSKVDLRTRVEKTNYFKKSYITSTNMGEMRTKSSNGVLFFYLILLPIFLYFVFLETKDIALMLRVPILYIGLIIYSIGIYFLFRGKTTLRGVKRIYEVIGDYMTIIHDNSLQSYNKKNTFTLNELKEAKIRIG